MAIFKKYIFAIAIQKASGGQCFLPSNGELDKGVSTQNLLSFHTNPRISNAHL
jgi:hypothetical protein